MYKIYQHHWGFFTTSRHPTLRHEPIVVTSSLFQFKNSFKSSLLKSLGGAKYQIPHVQQKVVALPAIKKKSIQENNLDNLLTLLCTLY